MGPFTGIPEKRASVSQTLFLPSNEPTDTELFFEFQSLSEQEKQSYFACLAVLREEGMEHQRAERDALAAVLQHKRLHAPTTARYEDWLLRGADFAEDTGPVPPSRTRKRNK